MGAFMIIQATITDPEGFAEYAKRAPAMIESFGGRYRSMRGERQQLEGPRDDRVIVVSEWPSMEAARTFWDSEQYTELRKVREGTAEISVYLTEITGE